LGINRIGFFIQGASMSDNHSFDRRQLRSYHLAGTVVLPSPFPEVGRLFLVPGGLKYPLANEGHPLDLLAIEHCQSNRVTITRYVALRDVSAVLFAVSITPTRHSEEGWFFGPEILCQLEARSNDNEPGLCMGIAYVRENAAVLMRVEVGMTAAESAEYYPPVVGERSDAHYALGGIIRPTDCSDVNHHGDSTRRTDCSDVNHRRDSIQKMDCSDECRHS
jgi:hypothetical protein